MAKNKYNATRTTYGGYNYDSKLEASYAMELDWRIKAGEVKEFQRQYRFDLTVNGKTWRSYKIDFRVELTDGSFEYVEVKGFPTQEWKMKWDMTKILFQELTEGENAKLILSTKQGSKVEKQYFK